MSADSKIEWTDATWNPIVGCTIVSPGCTNCYAMRDAWRKNFNTSTPHYKGLTKRVNGNAVWTGNVARAPDSIFLAPLGWRKPKRIFVNSMGDLFHESIPDKDIDDAFAVMALCPQHTFQVLTKRAERMREYMVKASNEPGDPHTLDPKGFEGVTEAQWHAAIERGWPLDNVWLGVSCERQQEADERIPLLLQTPAAVRFISAEPLLGAIDLTKVRHRLAGESYMIASVLDGDDGFGLNARRERLDWVIVGGESGSNARPMHPDWARSLRDQCAAAGVAFFFKQWGELIDADIWFDDLKRGPSRITNGIGGKQWEPRRPLNFEEAAILAGVCGRKCEHQSDGSTFIKVGKRSAGRLLDGREHSQFPKTEPTSVTDGSVNQSGLLLHDSNHGEAT